MNAKSIALLVLCIMAVVVVTGCMSTPAEVVWDKSSASPQSAMYTSGGYEADMNVAYARSSAPAPVPAATPHDSGSGLVETKIIKTAYVTIEVRDVAASAESLKAMAAEKGGYLSSTNLRTGYNNRLSGEVVMRIPQAEFENTLAGVKALGTLKSASTQGEDVTEEYVDLLARKSSYTNQLAQYNAIMKQSTKVEDIIKVQEQIDRVQTELDRLEGRLKYLNSRVDLATITVSLQEPEPVGGETGHNFVTTINEGIAGFIGMIDALIILFFTLLPLIILGGIGYYVHRWYKAKNPAVAPKDEKKE